ncbi:MAG: ISKra4 family transposase [Streptosporangiaceae bacterium]
MEPYALIPGAGPFAASVNLLTELVAELEEPAAAGLTACELEDLLAERGREVQRQLLQDHLDLRAAREEQAARAHHAPVTGADGITRSRLETGHGRLLASLFGMVRVTRCAWRRPGVPSLRPADAGLSLPACRPSHALARLAAVEAARGSFEAAHAAITRRCGPVIGKRQVEQAVVSAAADIAAFYAACVPVPCTASTLLVISADAKGIVMRPGALRPATARAAARQGRMRTRLVAGEKPNRKRMATLACVYDAEPSPRRPHDIIAPPGGRHGRRALRPRPRAKAKWLAGSVEHDPAEVIAAAFSQAEARDPGHLRTWVVLVDGAEHQLGLIRAEAARRGAAVHVVIDLIHVLEYIWKAAWCLHPAGDPAAEDWVAVKALAVLAGDSGRAAAEITAEADAAGLAAAQRTGADACVRYLTGKDEYLRYDQALVAGWPIATGVIEGACRHLIGDRLDITGARWGLQGAEAVLTLRAVISNGDFDEYWRYHLAREHQRLYPGTAQGQYALGA